VARVPEGWPNGITPADPTPKGIQWYLLQAAAASDLHLNVGVPPLVRKNGALSTLIKDHPPLTPEDTVKFVRMLLTPAQWEHFSATGDFDFSYAFPGGGRYRTNVFRERLGVGIKARLVASKIPTLQQLGLPEHAKRLTEYAQGLVLVTGPSGHGKTTSMMALVELVNQTRPDHIITVEDPIEYVLEGKKCQVSQREVGRHTDSFGTALRAALRENPDIIVIGDLRDYEATSMAISAAETGHLVFASLPTQDAAKTIDKVLDYFPPEEQMQIRIMVSESLRGILSQQLIPRRDGQGRIAAVELLFNSVAVANIIREANTAALTNAMQLGRSLGMQLMDESLKELLEKGLIAGEEAHARASDRNLFAQYA
jgi:twitching motility protein PilT